MLSYDKVRISKEWMFFCISPLPFKGIGKVQNHKYQPEMCLLTVANDRSSSDRELKISPRIVSWCLVGAQALVKAREAPALTLGHQYWTVLCRVTTVLEEQNHTSCRTNYKMKEKISNYENVVLGEICTVGKRFTTVMTNFNPGK